MVSRKYLLYLVTGFLIICLTAAIAGYFLGSEVKWFFIPLLVLVIIEVSLLLRKLNKVNRRISSFFLSVQNEDTAIQIPDKGDGKIIGEIYRSLNLVAERFRQVKMESEFREQLFLAMIEHSSTGFISIDQHGDFEIMNETARNLLDASFTSNIHRIRKEFPELYSILKSIRPREIRSCKIETQNKSTIVQVSASILKFHKKQLTLISLLDIKKEIELKELESWQKLIRIMNHEIMNSIAPITSVSKSLMKIFMREGKPIDSRKIDEKKIYDTISGLEVIESMSAGLSHFVGNYRQLSQIPKPVFELIQIDKWIEYLKTIGGEIAGGAQLHFSVQRGSKNFKGDSQLLNQVMINLIKNAAEAPINHERKEIIVSFEKTIRNSTLITIQNNGRPIEPEVLDKIFIPFFTTKEKGAGIGLFLSRQIISLHHGTISVISTQSDGTKFLIEI